MNRILLVEDEDIIRGALRRLLERNAYEVEDVASVEAYRENFESQRFDLIISDIRLPGAPGTDMIDLAQGTPVLLMTSYASVQSAVESMKRGALDYISKPFEHDELLMVVARTLRQRQGERQKAVLKHELDRQYPVYGMVGRSAAMRDICARIEKVAPTDATVLVQGESGTGKELVARALHEHSRRREAAFVAVNCAAIPEPLIESELFGHEQGAFAGAEQSRQGLVESAHGGSLFLDEIGELPATAQARLLRVLQDGEVRRLGARSAGRVDVRLITATHRDLKQRVREGAFREDLYFRIKVVELNLPPLRERGEDITLLAEFLLDKARQQLNRPPMSLTDEAMRRIRAHRWPGNVREMENVMERAVILSDGDRIGPDLLALDPGARFANTVADEELSLEEYFRHVVLSQQAELTETELARRLGISRKTLWERRQRYGIPRPRKGG